MDARIAELREHLETKRRQLDVEIRGYPTPIPRCDAQFNHLFERRARLAAALEALAELDPVDS